MISSFRNLGPTVSRRTIVKALAFAGVSWAMPRLSGPSIAAQQKTPPPRLPFKPREISPSEREAINEWRQLTSLAEGEIVKRIAPPFPPCRAVSHRAMQTFGTPRPLPDVKCVRWRPGDTRQGGGGHMGPASIPFIVDALLRIAIERQEIEGDPELLKAPIDGDWIVREGVPAEKVVPRLEEILRQQCKLPVKLRLDQAKREVIVAKGKYQFTPTAERKSIEVPTERGGGGGSDDFEGFLRAIGTRVHCQIINEVESPPQSFVQWSYRQRSLSKEPGTEDRADDSLLKHISEQTGLVFTKAKRNVPVLFVERAE